MSRPMLRLLTILAVTGVLAAAPGLEAQDRQKKPVPAAVGDSMQASMDAMMPMMGQMMAAMMTAMLDVAARPETAEKMATFSKNYFDALMGKGFNREEALRLVMSARLPSLPGGN